jgi:hypothetical protein
MRVTEIGIRAVARSLNVPDPTKPYERNWGNILKAVKTAIEGKWPTAADQMKSDFKTFDRLYVSLDAIKNPWRNATMYIENKYTEDEAEHIFVALRGFIRHLVTRMDENGQPAA